MTEAYGLRALQQEMIHLKEENRELREALSELRHAIRALTILDQSLDAINSGTDVYGLINGILLAAIQAVRAEEGSLLLLDADANELVFVDVVGTNRDVLLGTRMPGDKGIVGAVVQSKKPFLVSDARETPEFYAGIDEMIGFQTFSVICVPVLDGDRVLGAVELVNKRTEAPFDEDDMDILQLVARLASLALTKAGG